VTPHTGGQWTEAVLYSFKGGTDGKSPDGVIFDATGNLYGTTREGGTSGYGTVFKLTPNSDGSWTESVLHNFADHPASRPTSRLLFDESGNLYGTTSDGGSANAGTVFKIAPNLDGIWAFKVLHVFAGKPASSPNSLIEKTGNFYGSTALCLNEKKCAGVVFELIP
jgi:uncharacterized repeat protein (TIGR03803 family)